MSREDPRREAAAQARDVRGIPAPARRTEGPARRARRRHRGRRPRQGRLHPRFRVHSGRSRGATHYAGALCGPEDLTWMAYPKGSKAAGYDISRDTIWKFAATVGLVLNANVAIDDKLSAVRMRPANEVCGPQGPERQQDVRGLRPREPAQLGRAILRAGERRAARRVPCLARNTRAIPGACTAGSPRRPSTRRSAGRSTSSTQMRGA